MSVQAAVAERPRAASTPPAAVRRRFLQVGDRRVHYLRAGEGPPAVLVHSSPANAWYLKPEIQRLSHEHTVFAFDTPGFGLSQALPLETMVVADLADALAQTLRAIAMPPCPMFGTHTGAAIALEFGVRHAGMITGLVLDGAPAFTTAEYDALFGEYFRKLPVSALGGHYSDIWTRFRDQSIWFPWSARHPGHLNTYDLGAPESTHLWVSMFMEAADSYVPAYRAALGYCGRAVEAAGELTLPAIYTATDTDMLFPHMARLPPMKANQEIRTIGVSYEVKRELIAEGFTRFGSLGAAPRDADAVGSSAGVARQFLDRCGGGQLHLRSAGWREAAPLLLLHDAPGSAEPLELLIEALGAERFVIAPDLPGCGESDPLDGAATMEAYADVLHDLLDALGVERAEVYGIGFGASAALALAARAPGRVGRLILEGLLAPDPAQRAELKASYAPPIPIERDGSHWYRTWLMLRDSLVWWPWYDRTLEAQRTRPGDFGAERLHRWTLDVMRRRESYGDLIRAALDHDAPAALHAVRCPIVRLVDATTPLAAYDSRLCELTPAARELSAQGDPERLARMLFDLEAAAT